MAGKLGTRLGQPLVGFMVERGECGDSREIVMGMYKLQDRPAPYQTPVLAMDDVTTRLQPHTAMLEAELRASRDREAALRQEMQEAAQQQMAMGREFEHRLVNGLQII